MDKKQFWSPLNFQLAPPILEPDPNLEEGDALSISTLSTPKISSNYCATWILQLLLLTV